MISYLGIHNATHKLYINLSLKETVELIDDYEYNMNLNITNITQDFQDYSKTLCSISQWINDTHCSRFVMFRWDQLQIDLPISFKVPSLTLELWMKRLFSVSTYDFLSVPEFNTSSQYGCSDSSKVRFFCNFNLCKAFPLSLNYGLIFTRTLFYIDINSVKNIPSFQVSRKPPLTMWLL